MGPWQPTGGLVLAFLPHVGARTPMPPADARACAWRCATSILGIFCKFRAWAGCLACLRRAGRLAGGLSRHRAWASESCKDRAVRASVGQAL